MSKVKELTPEEFRKMQLLQLDMLVELDRICRKYDINYCISFGTLLGAVRHKGYIPWDDDADVCMLREDYERFKKVSNDLNQDICYFQDHDTDSEYRWGYGKLRRTGTVFVRAGQEHLKCKTGVFIDIFPLDDVPKSIPAQILQDFHCYCMRKTLWSEVGKHDTTGFKKYWFTLLSKIPPQKVFDWMECYIKKSSNEKSNGVRVLMFPAIGHLYRKNPISVRYGMPKKWFLERAEYEFEGKRLFGTKDFDAFLKYTYGDYMTLPPEDKREPHAPVSSYQF